MVRAAVVGAFLILSACDRSPYADWSNKKTAERADVADVNARNALTQLVDARDRIESLERQLRDAKTEAEAARSVADDAAAQTESLRKTFNELVDKHNQLARDVYNR